MKDFIATLRYVLNDLNWWLVIAFIACTAIVVQSVILLLKLW